MPARPPIKRPLYWLAVAFFTSAAAAPAAMAQQGVESKGPRPIQNLGGVKSQPARFISVGGQGGIPLNRTRTLLPAAPQPSAYPQGLQRYPTGLQRYPTGLQRYSPGGAAPGASSPDGDFTSGLVRPIVGPGSVGVPTVPIEPGVPGGTGGGYYVNDPRLAASGAWWCDDRIHHSGSHVDGAYAGDKFKIKFHLGSSYPDYCIPSGHYFHYPLSWYRSSWSYDEPPVIYSGPWYGNDPFVTSGVVPAQAGAQQGQQTAQPRELLAIEKAELAWRGDQIDEATRWFREHLDAHPDDTDAMRYLAMVLIDDRRVDQGVALMALAYEKNPKLAARPLPSDVLPGGASELRRRVNAVSIYANQTHTASAWLTLAVLMQAEGREPVAARILRRAIDSGLTKSIADEMTLSLAR